MNDPAFDPETVPRSEALDVAISALSAGWAAGTNPGAEAFADRLDVDDLVELAYHEFCLAESAGLDPRAEDYLDRFPAARDPLARILGLHGVLAASTFQAFADRTATLPDTGDQIGPYRLLRELGRGGLARVYLAEQADLDDRLVVVKVSGRASPEANLLARARHPHIVEVLRRAGTDDGGLHLIAMPFLGGATLSAVLAVEGRSFRRSGRGLLEALDRASAPEYLAGGASSAARGLLSGLSYAAAAAWIVARLADALDHAGRLGVTHGDLKPANILLAADARPMLLDFNLAVDWRSPESELSSVTGGTLAYMAPERLLALADPASATSPRPADRHRADLYSLGLVLRHVLTGEPPTVPDLGNASPRAAALAMAEARDRAEASLWTSTRGVPRGLRPILARCLAPDPADRYSRIGELAEDLDLWRAGLPLRYASSPTHSPPPALRWAWRRRKPIAAAAAIVLLASASAWGMAYASGLRLRRQAESKLEALWGTGDPAIFPERNFGRRKPVDDHAAEIARRNLDRYDVLGDLDWRNRDDVRALASADRDDLESWLMCQAWRLACSLSARDSAPEDWRRALVILERSPEWASLTAWDSLRRELREKLELPAPASPNLEVRPDPWLDRFASGLAAEPRSAAEAIASFDEALRDRPEAFWAHLRVAAMASRRSDFTTAVGHLEHCLRRRPRNVALIAQRAGCLEAAGDHDLALAECRRALDLDPDCRTAYYIRAKANASMGRTSASQADIDRFVALSRSRPADAWAARWILDRGTSLASRVVGAAEIQGWLAIQLAKNGKTEPALAAYDRALEYDPEDLCTRYNRAAHLIQIGRNEGWYEMSSLIVHSKYEELIYEDETTLRACHFAAHHHLVRGAISEARAVAERALALALGLRPPGAVESPMVAESRYALARCLAATARDDAAVARRAAKLLGQAGSVDPRFVEEKFLRDAAFDSSREVIAAYLASDGKPSR